MASFSVGATTLEAIVDWFDAEVKTCGCWAIFHIKNPYSQYEGGSIDEAREKLLTVLQRIAASPDHSTQIFTLHTYAAKKKGPFTYNDEKAAVNSFRFRDPMATVGQAPASEYYLHNLAGEMAALRSEISALKAEKVNEEEEEEEESQEDKIAGLLGAATQFMNIPFIANILNNISGMGQNNQGQKIITNLSGVDPADADRAARYQYVEILLQKGVKPEHLRKLAEMPTAKIKSLLLML